MAIDKVTEYFKSFGMDNKILQFDVSSATVALAAEALGCEPERIAKTLCFKKDDGCVLIVAAGDAKVDNSKFKSFFGFKAKMPSGDEVEELCGHAIGGVCPFAVKEGVEVFLDVSLNRFDTVFPACGSSNSAIELTVEQLKEYSKCNTVIDVCKGWQEQ